MSAVDRRRGRRDRPRGRLRYTGRAVWRRRLHSARRRNPLELGGACMGAAGAGPRDRRAGAAARRATGLHRASLARIQRRDHGRSARLHVRGYGYRSFRRYADPDGPVARVTGNPVGALALVAPRVLPFLVPLALVLLMRLVDGRSAGSTRSADADGPERPPPPGRAAGDPRVTHGVPALSASTRCSSPRAGGCTRSR